ncbi:hypothetical protein ACQU0X_26890 [Pseudovibrio ascidiaceicola]|uniref:hypothetical protein n=1 Tax=Pseudovibrio ascidiaceicola TaxID=285279 RepID=UPI003D36B777
MQETILKLLDTENLAAWLNTIPEYISERVHEHATPDDRVFDQIAHTLGEGMQSGPGGAMKALAVMEEECALLDRPRRMRLLALFVDQYLEEEPMLLSKLIGDQPLPSGVKLPVLSAKFKEDFLIFSAALAPEFSRKMLKLDVVEGLSKGASEFVRAPSL